ncbi:hypothetical protein Poli38472_009798 [Pythium oligandrum]|uniref:Uncharacterized protein n=1 Tax=Pythium oligandrum TaxID=41045 RepID=A0A8K1CFK8_PYTOL|nr:hypothetical protein Poli38472_009798 [Pythium oligandrum]|eukprot:TMW62305.1 hypothetical protein Poli38472_009798 [Pythium oligandrum]
MNIFKGTSNSLLRDAILEGSIEKTRRYLTLKLGKADASALTESGGFSMLHVASLVGNTQIVMMILQYGADTMALTDDGYSALDLAIWKGHLQIIELLRSQGCIAPMKEPESLNGKIILHLGRKATVVDFEPSTSIRTRSLRALFYEDTGEGKLVNLWAGTDYKIVGNNPYYEDLKKHDYQYAEIPASQPEMFDDMLQGRAFIDNDDDDDDDDEDDDEDDDDDDDSDDESEIEVIIDVKVPPGPLGVLLDSGVQKCAVVHGFTNLPTGGKGPIEMDGRVQPGMYIIGINETNASLMSLQEVTQLLGKLSRKEKSIRFALFQPGSPKKRSEKKSNGKSKERAPSNASLPPSTPSTVSAAGSGLPPPAPTPPAASTPSTAGSSIFSGRFASIATAMMDRKGSTAKSTTPSASAAATPSASASEDIPLENECLHCGMPTAIHKTADCPYRSF